MSIRATYQSTNLKIRIVRIRFVIFHKVVGGRYIAQLGEEWTMDYLYIRQQSYPDIPHIGFVEEWDWLGSQNIEENRKIKARTLLWFVDKLNQYMGMDLEVKFY